MVCIPLNTKGIFTIGETYWFITNKKGKRRANTGMEARQRTK